MNDLWRFAKLYRPFKLSIFVGMMLTLAALAAGVALLAVSGWFIAAMGLAGAAAISMNYFTPAAIIRGLSIVRTASRYGERLSNHDAALRVTAIFRQRFFNSLALIAPESLRACHSAELLERLRGDIDTLERFYLQSVAPLCAAVLALILLFIIICFYNVVLACLMLGALMLTGFIIPFCSHKLSHHKTAQISQRNHARRRHLSEAIQGGAELVIYQQMKPHMAALEQMDQAIDQDRRTLHQIETMAQSLTVLISGLTLIATLYLCLPLLAETAPGALSGADYVLLALLAIAAFEITSPLPAALQAYQAAKISARRVFEIADRKQENRSQGIPCERARDFSLSCSHVDFAYLDKPVLKDFSMDLKAGAVVLISGVSGSGKSTLSHILAGFYKAQAGEILVNQHKIDDYAPDALRAHFAFAPQKPYLFADTLRQNLLIAAPDADESALLQACALAHLDDVIAAMPAGLDSYVGEHGTCLSGGQLRRVGLARALLCNAPCLVLDEPTEGLNDALAHDVMRNILRHAQTHKKAVILLVHEAEQSWLPPGAQHIRLT